MSRGPNTPEGKAKAAANLDNPARKAPWGKGVSGNPGGRKPEHPEIREALKLALPQALARLIELTKVPEPGPAVAACKVIFEYGLAKPAPVGPDGKADRLEDFVRLLKGEG